MANIDENAQALRTRVTQLLVRESLKDPGTDRLIRALQQLLAQGRRGEEPWREDLTDIRTYVEQLQGSPVQTGSELEALLQHRLTRRTELLQGLPSPQALREIHHTLLELKDRMGPIDRRSPAPTLKRELPVMGLPTLKPPSARPPPEASWPNPEAGASLPTPNAPSVQPQAQAGHGQRLATIAVGALLAMGLVALVYVFMHRGVPSQVAPVPLEPPVSSPSPNMAAASRTRPVSDDTVVPQASESASSSERPAPADEPPGRVAQSAHTTSSLAAWDQALFKAVAFCPGHSGKRTLRTCLCPESSQCRPNAAWTEAQTLVALQGVLQVTQPDVFIDGETSPALSQALENLAARCRFPERESRAQRALEVSAAGHPGLSPRLAAFQLLVYLQNNPCAR